MDCSEGFFPLVKFMADFFILLKPLKTTLIAEDLGWQPNLLREGPRL
jgi:hypothetical protein